MNECNLRAELGERLKQARAGLGLTQKELCLRVGLPLQSLKDYEGSKRLPGSEALCAYASAGIRVDWLLTGKGPMLAADQVDQEQLAALRAQAAQPAPPDIDTQLLATCIKGVYLAEPGCPPDRAALEAVEFYGRFQAMKMKKPAAA